MGRAGEQAAPWGLAASRNRHRAQVPHRTTRGSAVAAAAVLIALGRQQAVTEASQRLRTGGTGGTGGPNGTGGPDGIGE